MHQVNSVRLLTSKNLVVARLERQVVLVLTLPRRDAHSGVIISVAFPRGTVGTSEAPLRVKTAARRALVWTASAQGESEY
jgi:hypothetical protein